MLLNIMLFVLATSWEVKNIFPWNSFVKQAEDFKHKCLLPTATCKLELDKKTSISFMFSVNRISITYILNKYETEKNHITNVATSADIYIV